MGRVAVALNRLCLDEKWWIDPRLRDLLDSLRKAVKRERCDLEAAITLPNADEDVAAVDGECRQVLGEAFVSGQPFLELPWSSPWPLAMNDRKSFKP